MLNRFQEWTKYTYRVVTKKYCQWVYGLKEQDYPPIVSWIHTRVKNSNHILPNELLDEEDLKRLLAAAEKDPRDKAFIMTFRERLPHVNAVRQVSVDSSSNV